jgi:hypothetical protein
MAHLRVDPYSRDDIFGNLFDPEGGQADSGESTTFFISGELIIPHEHDGAYFDGLKQILAQMKRSESREEAK